MTINLKKYELVLLGICFISIFLYMPFNNSELRYDIYLFLDYSSQSKYEGRKLTFIIYEICSYLRTIIPFYILMKRLPHYIFKMMFIILFFEFIFYLLFYGQGTDPYLVVITCILILPFIYKAWKKKSLNLG